MTAGAVRPQCAVQVDMDSFATLLRYYGYPSDDAPEPFYDLVIPRLIELFNEHKIRATVFVVGSEVRGSAGRWLRELITAGHEIANHSHTHPYGMTRWSPQAQEQELIAAEQAIVSWTGNRPVGFRNPGYDVDEPLLALLESRGYWYDSSVFPTTLSIPIRLMQTWTRLRRQAEHGTMGRLSFLRAPRQPYRPAAQSLWRVDPARPLVELPVATLPMSRLPFYGTAVLSWGSAYAAAALRQLRSEDIVFAMHAVDVLGPDQDQIDPRLNHHPGIRLPVARKLALFKSMFDQVAQTHRFVTSCALAIAHRDSTWQHEISDGSRAHAPAPCAS